MNRLTSPAPLALMALLASGLFLLLHSQSPVQEGYGLIFSDSGSFPAATALFSFRNEEGILIWEAGVEAVRPLRRGQLFVDQTGTTRTAFALANPHPEPLDVTLRLADASGLPVGSTTQTLNARRHEALFVDELFDFSANFTGTLSFDTGASEKGIGVITLRLQANHLGEPIFATFPVASRDELVTAGISGGSLIFPHIGAGPSISTELVLIGSEEAPTTGTIRFVGSDGNPLELEARGLSASEFPVSIAPGGVFSERYSSPSETRAGYAVFEADEGQELPDGSAIFQLLSPDGIQSEAGVAVGAPTTRTRLFVDNRGTRIGVAVASPENPGMTVQYRLFDLDGGLLDTTARELPPNGHLPRFVDEFFENLPADFQGILEVSAPVAFFAITLKMTLNQRGDPILTTLPVNLENPPFPAGAGPEQIPPTTDFLIFPQIGIGSGLDTNLLLVGRDTADEGSIQFFDSSGAPLRLSFGNETGSLFNYRLAPGGGRALDSNPESAGPLLPTDRIPDFNLQIEPAINAPTSPLLDAPHTGGIDIIAAAKLPGVPGLMGCRPVPLPPQDTGLAHASGAGVYLHSGEFFVYEIDLEIPGRGFNWRFARKYRSGITYDGILGRNWSFNYERRLIVVGAAGPLSQSLIPQSIQASSGDVLRLDGLGRVDIYRRNADGSYRSPQGFFTQLIRNVDGSFRERDAHGNIVRYLPLREGVARMTALEDRNRNLMRFVYDDSGRLVRVVDTLSRTIDYEYNQAGYLSVVRDFMGREIRFGYDSQGNLTQVTSPRVTGTPNGNDFLEGKTTAYIYSGGSVDRRLNHNLLSIVAPNEVAASQSSPDSPNPGPARIQVEYDAADRVVRQTVGGTNSSGVPAGGAMLYERLSPTLPSQVVLPGVNPLRVTDRSGNQTLYSFTTEGNVARIEENAGTTPRPPGSPFSTIESYLTFQEFNEDGLMTRAFLPEGNSVQCEYDREGGDRLQHGNLLSRVLFSDEDRSGDQSLLVSTWTYEPVYNRVRTATEARGNDPDYIPPNGGSSFPERYTLTRTFDYQEANDVATLAQIVGISPGEMSGRLAAAGIPMGLGEVNRNADTTRTQGNVIRVEYPSVELPPATDAPAGAGFSTQSIVTFSQFNEFGQVTASFDAEQNRTTYRYYQATDPDGDGQDPIVGVGAGEFGYLRLITQDDLSGPDRNSGTDPAPVRIQTRFRYDPVGNVIRKVDGRGIATDYSVNQLNQVVRITRAAQTGLFPNDPIEPLPLSSFGYREELFYDSNDNLILERREDRGNTSQVGSDSFVDQSYGYDILDQTVEVRREVSEGHELTTRYRYDANGNPVLQIQPEGNAEGALFDERDLLYRTTRGAFQPPPSALLNPSDQTDYDVRGGVPSVRSFNYDRNGNLVEIVDAADTDGSVSNNAVGFGADRIRYLYDGFDRLTSRIDSIGNQTVYQYDPAGNVVRSSRFGPTSGPSPISDGDDPLEPVSRFGVIMPESLAQDGANLLESTEYSFDELNRPFQIDRLLFLQSTPSQRSADLSTGAQDLGKGALNPGATQAIPGLSQPILEGRVSRRYLYDRNSRQRVVIQDDLDTFRSFYDGANRLTETIDPEGNLVEYAYDDNHNTIEIIETDVPQMAGLPQEAFSTTYFYDSLNRPSKQVDNLGQTIDYRYDSRDNLVAAADASGPGGSPINRRRGNGTVTTNRFGNVTRYFYDGIDRLIEQEFILTASGRGDGNSVGASMEGVKNAVPQPDLTQGEGDGRITLRYEWDDNSLISSRTDDRGNQTVYEYDNLNRKVAETAGNCVPPTLAERCDPATTRTYQYDRDHNLRRVTDENGSTIDYQYDAANRHIQTIVNRAAEVTGTTRQTFQYDGLSRLTRATDNNQPGLSEDNSLVEFSYDSLSRVFEERQQIGTQTVHAISSAWRSDNLRSSLIYPDARKIDYTYDRLDRLATLRDTADGHNLAEYSYIGATRVLERRFPENGTRLSFLDDAGLNDVGYDALRRPVQLRHLADDDSLIVGFTHDYDRMNNKRVEEKLHAVNNSELYRYDSAYRLVEFQRGSLNANRDAIETPAPEDVGGKREQTWELDGAGNWTSRAFTEFLVEIPDFREHSSFNELVSQRFSEEGEVGAFSPIERDHDPNGNEIAQGDDSGGGLFGGARYEWDFLNRLRVVRQGSGELLGIYTYDALGRRIRKRVPDDPESILVTDYYLDGPRVIQEELRADSPETGGVTFLQQYVYGNTMDELLVMDPPIRGGGLFGGVSRVFYHSNTLDSIYALTDPSARVLEGYQYDPYGRQRVFLPESDGNVKFGISNEFEPGTIRSSSALGNPYTFTGRRYDPESGLFYFRMRYLDTFQGRFISRDPEGIWGDPANLGNAYAYVGNNPANRIDPLGTQGEFLYDQLTPGHRWELTGAGYAFGEPDWPMPETESLPLLPDDSPRPVPEQPNPIPEPHIPRKYLDDRIFPPPFPLPATGTR